MNNPQLKGIMYISILIAIIARFIFMFVIYKNKSTDILVLLFCILNLVSFLIWLYYSSIQHDGPMLLRSSTEIVLLAISCIYIMRNIVLQKLNQKQCQYHSKNQILSKPS